MKDPLSVERLTRIRELFEEAVSMPETERTLFLDKTCDGDRELHGRVSALLAEANSGDSPFEDLVNELIWPTLESLSNDPSKLQRSLKDILGSDSDEEDPLIGKLVSRFEILASIGRGGMGMVYRAHDRTLDRTVALKFLPPSLSSDQRAKDRFIHEAKAASGLNHPNIATVYEIGETADQQLFIAMGYYPGETLKEKIARGPIAPDLAIDIAVQLASGMKDAHGHGVIHRDIKPGNVMISEEGTAVLLDFGLAKLSFETGYTQVGQMAGTLAYMSPEQARSEAIDQRTDIWSFGVVLYEMLTGKRPFGGENAQSAIRSILEEDPKPPEAPDGEIPEPLKRVIGLCLAKNPKHRYQHAEDLLEDLQRAREGLAPKKRGGRAAWNRRSRRRRGIVSGVSAVVLAVGIVSIQPFLASERNHYTFTRITEGAIVEDTGNFSGLAWGDYDDDGYVDVVVANNEEGGLNHLYRNNGDGTFSRVTEGILVTDPVSAHGVAWADQDNDGDLDLFAGTYTYSNDAFYRNEGDGTFSKVTEGDWVNTPGSAISVAWGDYDNDGFVDLYVSQSGGEDPEYNLLYHNNGDGTMTPVTTEANGIKSISYGCLWSDYDGDGDLDLFVSFQEKVQFRNDGDGSFTWIPPEDGGLPAITEDVDVTFSSADFDNDGDMDLLRTTWKLDPSNLLYRNEENRYFLDVSHVLPSRGSIRAVGSAWGDYDNDGFQDLFIANYMGKNLLYHNMGNGSFTIVADGPIVSDGGRSAGCAWADYDNDGDLDLFVSNGLFDTFEQSCELYRNNGGANNWIVLNLVGTVSNRSAIGAKVWANASIDGYRMNQLREIQGGGNGKNQIGSRAHFGLGDATIIDTLRIDWPSGQVQEMSDVAANQFLTITENTVEDSESLEEQESSRVVFTPIKEGAIVEDKGKFACLAWGDYDGDGHGDVVVADNKEGGLIHLYRNNGDGTFSRVTEGILVTDPVTPFSLAWADQDNDGDLDLFVGTGPKSANAFYRNEGDGIFTKVTEGDWVNTPGSEGSVAWGDYDNDGFVDLYVSTLGVLQPESNFLYHNNGDGTMEAVSIEANASTDQSGSCLWSDYDDDGDVDLFVAQEKAQFRNNGDGTFTWIPPEDGGIPVITEEIRAGFSSANYDNDRDLDYLYTTWKSHPGTLLFRNEFKARLRDVTHVLPSKDSIRGLTSTWGDYDNDGFQDLFIANNIGKNILYHNEGNGSFRQITESPVVSEGLPSAGAAWADYDNDGDLDLIVSNGMWSEFEESCKLFRNDGGSNNWIQMSLVGTVSNRSAIGAKVWARTTMGGQSMTQLREIHGGGHGNNQPDMRVHFGLRDATIIDSLRIEWPSGQVQEMSDVAANQFLTVIEDVDVDPSLTAGEAQIVHTFEDDPPLYASPEGIALDQNGNIFVSLRTFDGSSYVRNEIVEITPSGESMIIVDLGPAGPHGLGALGLATDAFGNVYAAFSGGDESNGVWKISPDGRSEHLSGSENINVPNSLTFDEHGNLYVTDCFPAVPTDPGLVWRYGPGGVFEIWASSELLAPDPDLDPLGPPPPADPIAAPGANGIVFAPPNHIYVANTEKCLILDVLVLTDGSAGDISIVAGAYPPTSPPGLLFAPDGLALDAEGNLYTVAPPVGFTGFPLSPVIKIIPATGEVEAILEPILEPSPLFDFPTTLAFGTGPLDHRSLFVVGITARTYGFEGSGPKITQVGVGVPGHTGK